MHRVRSILRPLGAVTALGWSVAGIGVVAWGAGALLGWQELMLVAATCLVLLLISALSMVGKLDLASELRVEPARVVVGERAAGSLIVTNQSSRKSRAVRVELPVGKTAAVFDVPRLAPGGTYDELFVVPTSKRAIIPVGPVITVQGDPLGLMRRTHTWSDTYEIFVHPATTILDTISAGLVRDLEGQTTNHLTTSDVAFHTLRDYVPGDDRRHVHWKTSAKLNQLMVRQYVDTRRSHVCVLLSTDPADFAGEEEFELAVSAAASLVLQASRDEQTLTVIVGGDEWPSVHPKTILDRFSGVEIGEIAGGVDACFATARRCAPDASVTSISVGSPCTVPTIRRAATRAPLDTKIVAVQCSPEVQSAYRHIGNTAFVQVTSLGSLRRGLTAVL